MDSSLDFDPSRLVNAIECSIHGSFQKMDHQLDLMNFTYRNLYCKIMNDHEGTRFSVSLDFFS